MLLGYNTNGLANHGLSDAIELVWEIGYRSIAITVDHHAISPFASEFAFQLSELKKILARCPLRTTIETGARYLLDRRAKHQPTLMTATTSGRRQRIDFYQSCIDIAAELGSDSVSLWSGPLQEPLEEKSAWRRLTDGLVPLLDHAGQQGIDLAFEPEPGMFVDTMARFARLRDLIDHPRLLLTVDIGHLHCQGETPIADYLRQWQDQIVNIHIEDMLSGIHDHLMFGDGEIDFAPIIRTLAEISYQGPIHVELSRHSHVGPAAAQQSYDFLMPLILATQSG